MPRFSNVATTNVPDLAVTSLMVLPKKIILFVNVQAAAEIWNLFVTFLLLVSKNLGRVSICVQKC